MYKNFVKSTFPLFNLEKQNVSENERIILKTASIAFCFFPLLFSSLVFCFLFFYFFIVFCCSSFFYSLKENLVIFRATWNNLFITLAVLNSFAFLSF